MTNLTQSQPKTYPKGWKQERDVHQDVSKPRSEHVKHINPSIRRCPKYIPKSSQNSSQNHQKSSQKRPLEPPRNPTWTKVAFETPYFPLSGSKRVPNGTPKSTKNRSCFRPVFEWLLGTTFLCFWPPFGLPKDLQNETQKGSKITDVRLNPTTQGLNPTSATSRIISL